MPISCHILIIYKFYIIMSSGVFSLSISVAVCGCWMLDVGCCMVDGGGNSTHI